MNESFNKRLITILVLVIFLLSILSTVFVFASQNQQNSTNPDLIGVVSKISGDKITITVAKLSTTQQGFGRGRGNIELTKQTKTIQVSKTTSLVANIWENNQIKEIKISVKDLRKNDILYIWFADKKKGTIKKIQFHGTYNPYAVPELIGVIKKISGDKITITVATISRPQQPANGQNSNAQNNRSQAAQNRSSQGNQPNQGGFGFGRMNNVQLTNQTKTIQVTKSTTIITITRENNQMKEKKLTIKDLKANNIIWIWYADKNKGTVSRIQVNGTYSANAK